MDLEFAWALFQGVVQEYQSYLIAGGCFIAAGWLFKILRDRRRTREAKAREYAATHCAHGVNKFTRSCRKCAREWEAQVRAEEERKFPLLSIAAKPTVPDYVFDPIRKSVARGLQLAGKHEAGLTVTVRFRGVDGRFYSRKHYIHSQVVQEIAS